MIWQCSSSSRHSKTSMTQHDTVHQSTLVEITASKVRIQPRSSGYERRLLFQRLCVRIPAPYTGWTFFTYIFVVKFVMCLKNVPGLAKKNIKIQNMTNKTTSILHCSGNKKSKNKNKILLILAKKLKRLIFLKKLLQFQQVNVCLKACSDRLHKTQ